MRIKISILLSFGFLMSFCYGQSVNQLNESINESIKKHISEQQYPENNLETSIFLRDNIPSDFQLEDTTMDNQKVAFFDKEQYRKSELKKGINACRLLPVKLEDNILSITIVNVFIVLKSKKLTISNSDYTTYEYRYFCNENEWKFLKMKQTGI